MSEVEHFNERFWNDSTLWPEDAPGFIFLPRAIRRLEILFYPEPLMAPPESGSDTDDEEATAEEDAFAIYVAAKINRRSEIMSRFIAACRSGTLACAVRPKLGGKFTKLEQAIWNSERCHHWFRLCDISLQAPYDTDEEADWSNPKQWLFVTAESLANLAAPAPETPALHTSRHLSPYMRLMISVIEDLGITPTNQPNLESLKKEFADRWQKLFDEKLSDRLSHAMASLVRDPESQGGRAKSRSRIKT